MYRRTFLGAAAAGSPSPAKRDDATQEPIMNAERCHREGIPQNDAEGTVGVIDPDEKRTGRVQSRKLQKGSGRRRTARASRRRPRVSTPYIPTSTVLSWSSLSCKDPGNNYAEAQDSQRCVQAVQEDGHGLSGSQSCLWPSYSDLEAAQAQEEVAPERARRQGRPAGAEAHDSLLDPRV